MQDVSFLNVFWNNNKYKAWCLFRHWVLHFSPTWNSHRVWNAQERWEGAINIKWPYNGEHTAVHLHWRRQDLHIKFPLLWVMGHLLISEVTNPVVKRMSSENKLHLYYWLLWWILYVLFVLSFRGPLLPNPWCCSRVIRNFIRANRSLREARNNRTSRK